MATLTATGPVTHLHRPLSAAQLGIWLGQQFNTASPLYNAAEYIEVRGALDIALFEHALQHVINESVALNLVFTQTANGPMQLFQPVQTCLTYKDYRSFAAPREQARLWMASDLATTTDLTQGPLFHQAFITLGEQHYYWYQRIHHISSDGFSFALLSQKVAHIYNALINNQPNDAPAPALTAFHNVLDEDKQYQQSSYYLKDQQFWAGYLTGQRTPVSLSPSLAPIADIALRTSTTINTQLFAAIKDIAQQLAANWPDIVIAAVAQLIYQRTATTETTLGIPVMNRMGSASLRVPAMVMNIIPLRIKFTAATPQPISFRQLVQQIAQDTKTSRPHQRYRYEQLKRDLNKTGGDQRLFGAVVNIMPFDRQLDFNGCTAQAHNLSAGPVEDLSFAFVLQADGSLRFDLDANPNRYHSDELDTIQRELLSILNNVPALLEQPLAVDVEKLSWLAGAGFGEKKSPLPSVLQDIFQHIQNTPDAVALQTENHTLTYKQLGKKISACVQALRDAGVASNSVIALALTRSEGAIIGALATLLSGNTFVFIDPQAPAARNQLILGDAKPAVLVYAAATDAENLKQLVADTAIRTLPLTDMCNREVARDWQAIWQNAATLPGTAYLIYTSGSTGTPKGVIISHRALAEFVASTDDAYAINQQDHVLQFAPLHFDACIEEIFVTLARGARLVLRNDAMLESMPRFIAQCAAWNISVLDLPTAFWHELAFACATATLDLPPTLRTIIIGGEAVLPERVMQWRERYADSVALFNTYGPSEATVIATYANLTQPGATLSIGQPLSGRAIAVVDSDLRIVPRGESGELLLLGGGLSDGYLHLPEKTAASFIDIQFPWSTISHRAYRTGDRVNINREQQLDFIGRLDDQIKISGYRIDPLEIEAALVALVDVQEAAIVAQQTNGITSLIAHIVSDTSYDIARLRAALKQQLPAPMLPAAVVTHKKLPKNSSGKVDRKQLLAASEFSSIENAAQVDANPATEQQQIIINVWQEILGPQPIATHNDFFLLGGQSLQTIQVANRLAALLGREVPVTLLFQHPTVAALADALFGDAGVTTNTTAQDVHTTMLADCLEFEMALPANDKPLQHNAIYQQILLTGATGFVGAHLLHQLLQQTRATIICAVRANSEAIAFDRIKKSLAQQGLPCTDVKRIRIVLADLEKPLLGLTPAAHEALANTIDTVIHNAAITSVMRDYHSLRAANALSTGELLKIAARRAVPFHLISTIAVAPPTVVAAELDEEFVAIHRGLQDGYQQSKWVSEQMVAIAQQKGYAINVYRLARVTGAVVSGYINPKDLVWSIIQTGIRNHALPELPISEPWTPVDAIARFIVADALANPGQGVCNVTPERNVELAQLYEWLTQYGFNFSILPIPAWYAQVKRNSEQNGSLEDQAILGFFAQRKALAESDNNIVMGKASNHKFSQKMHALGLQLPLIDNALFERYLRYAISSGLLRVTAQPVTYSSEYQEAES